MVASGALHASALSLLRKHVSPENAGELFELCAHRSARKVEELLAARFPRPDVRDLVRRLTRFAIPGGVPAHAGLTLDVERASEKCASETMPMEVPPREPTAPQQTAFVVSAARINDHIGDGGAGGEIRPTRTVVRRSLRRAFHGRW